MVGFKSYVELMRELRIEAVKQELERKYIVKPVRDLTLKVKLPEFPIFQNVVNSEDIDNIIDRHKIIIKNSISMKKLEDDFVKETGKSPYNNSMVHTKLFKNWVKK
ncbi:MAG: hypothetical protein WC307_07255 [Candidatus Nanoarchaeia archaeon]|jgi:hypothetical protein